VAAASPIPEPKADQKSKAFGECQRHEERQTKRDQDKRLARES